MSMFDLCGATFFSTLNTFCKMKVPISLTIGSSANLTGRILNRSSIVERSFYRKVIVVWLLTSLHTFRKMKVPTSLTVGSR